MTLTKSFKLISTKHKVWLFMLFTLFIYQPSYSQDFNTENDTLVVDTIHSPRLATLLSAFLPGTGQFYNQKYWKIPVIYITGGALAYSVIYNTKGHIRFKDAYNYLYENPDQPQEGFEGYSLEQLKSIKGQYRRYRDLSIIGITLLYVLNVVDATVDGYLFDFDVSDDLSLRLEPSIINIYTQELASKDQQSLGFKCTFKF